MGNIKPYDPGNLANRVVGTPGVDPSAGRAGEALAQGANQVRNSEADLANQTANFYGGLLGQVGKAAGAIAGREIEHRRQLQAAAAKAAREQQRQLDDLGVVADGHNFAQDANSTFNDYQQKYINNPEQIVPAMQDYLNNSKEVALRKYTDPLLKAKAEANFDGTVESVMTKAGAKSLDMQHAQSMAMAPNMVTAARQSISKQTGSIDDRVQNFATQAHIMKLGITRMAPALGMAETERMTNAGMHDVSQEFMNNLVNERPDDPVEAIQHLGDARKMLHGAVTNWGVLNDGERQRIAGDIDAAEDKEIKELDNRELSVQLDNSAKIAQQHFQLYVHRDDPEIQKQAINWAVNEVGAKQQQIEQINQSRLPDKAKIVAKRSAIAQINQLQGLVETAHANQRYQDAVKRGDMAEAKRLRAEQDRATKEAERQAKEELKANQQEAQTELADKRLRLRDLMSTLSAENFGSQKQEIIKLGAEISSYTEQMRKAGYLTPSQAFRGGADVNHVVGTLANYKESAGWFIFPPSVQKLTGPRKAGEYLKNQAAIMSELQKQAAIMGASDKQDHINQHTLTPQQQAYYDDWAGKIRATAKQQGWTDRALQSRLTTLYGRTLAYGNAPPPPSAQQLNSAGEPHTLNVTHAPTTKGFVSAPAAGQAKIGTAHAPSDYNGNIDITQRQIVDFPHGLDESNSTPAARKEFESADFKKQFGEAFPPGSYGSEFSMQYRDGKDIYSIPTIFNGKVHSSKEAIEHFKKTGQYLGRFAKGTPDSVIEDYENRVHSREISVNGKVYKGGA